ncbi:short-chain dehydrogenase/reductase SDR [Hysterangium stoloniferum]|nr:short-chain dehydrogenase/reductase SDR [Hysterangium stoloniferum]
MSIPQDRVAVITGASSGIGRVTSISLSKAGWNVVLFARNDEELGITAKSCPGPSLTVKGDVSKEEDVTRLFSEAVRKFGRVDLLFNNAGIARGSPIEEISLEVFQSVINVNVIGVFLCTREAVKLFKKQTPQGGRIINNGSISAHTPRPNASPYTTSKHAVLGLTKSTALEGRSFDISVTQIDIGNAATPLAKSLGTGTLQADGSLRAEALFDVQHVADAIVHIAGLPTDVQVLEMNIMATKMPFVGRG